MALPVSVCLPVCLSACLSVCLSACLSICPPHLQLKLETAQVLEVADFNGMEARCEVDRCRHFGGTLRAWQANRVSADTLTATVGEPPKPSRRAT
jgi:hypothetical protein